MEPWLTTADIARLFGYSDLRAARARIKELGGRKFGGSYRLHPDALDACRHDPDQDGGMDTADHRPSRALRPAPRSPRDPRTPPEPLEPGWWKQEQP